MENIERLEIALFEFVERVIQKDGPANESETAALPKVAEVLARLVASSLHAENSKEGRRRKDRGGRIKNEPKNNIQHTGGCGERPLVSGQ